MASYNQTSEILSKPIKSFKVSIEKKSSEEYLVGILINENVLIYNESIDKPFKKFQVLEVIFNITKMKYNKDFRVQNIESTDPIYKVIATYHLNKPWKCPVEFLFTKKTLLSNKLVEKNFEDIEDLFLV